MSIFNQPWKHFKISDLFDVSLASGDIREGNCEAGDIPLVVASNYNNGIVAYTNGNCDKPSKIFDGGKITVSLFGKAFYQPEPFYSCSHGRVNILSPKFELTPRIALFICRLIDNEQYRICYGRSLFSHQMRELPIKLPLNSDGGIDWSGIETYMSSIARNIRESKLKEYNALLDSIKLVSLKEGKVPESPTYKAVKLSELFDIKRGNVGVKQSRVSGNLPLVSATKYNNGVSDHVETTEVFEGNAITLSVLGDVFYQPEPFAGSVSVNVLRPKFELTPLRGLYITTILQHEKFRFDYSRKVNLSNFENLTIRLPWKDGSLDVDYIDNYMMSVIEHIKAAKAKELEDTLRTVDRYI